MPVEKGEVLNPTGKGGFADHPENISPGGWKKENVFSYQYKRFMNMSVNELAEWEKTPDDKKTVVEDLAYKRVIEAKVSLLDVKEITDRTEGKPLQKVEQKTELTTDKSISISIDGKDIDLSK